MTQYEGIRTASDGRLLLAIERLHEECLEHPLSSPRYKAAIKWLSSTRQELRRRAEADWGNVLGFMTRDYGDEA